MLMHRFFVYPHRKENNTMQDILKALVSSRQQGGSSQNADPMADLVGGLLGGSQQSQGTDQIANLVGGLLGGAQQQPQAPNSVQQSGGLGSMMGLLETVMGGQGNSSADPIMGLLKPFVAPLAKKANISPEIAMIVVSFVAHKLLAHHPTSNRDSNTFDLDNMLQQMGSGKIDSNLLHNSGMVKELSRKTGLDEATAAKSLQAGFSLVGKSAVGAGIINKNKPTAKPKVTTGKTLKSSGMKSGAKVKK
jgi:hypothetical protein